MLVAVTSIDGIISNKLPADKPNLLTLLKGMDFC